MSADKICVYKMPFDEPSVDEMSICGLSAYELFEGEISLGEMSLYELFEGEMSISEVSL
jgi:hypothetical protein